MNWFLGLSAAALLIMAAPQEKPADPVSRVALYRFQGVEDFNRLQYGAAVPEEPLHFRDGHQELELECVEYLGGDDKSLLARLVLYRTDSVTDQDLDDAALALWARYRAEVLPVLRARVGAMKEHRDVLRSRFVDESKRLLEFVAGPLGDPKAQAASSAERGEVLRFRLADARIDRSVKEAQLAALRERYAKQREEAIEAGLFGHLERLREYETKYTKEHKNVIEAKEMLDRERVRLEKMGPADETTRQLYVRILDLEVDLIGLEARQRAVEEDLAREQQRLAGFRQLEDLTPVEERRKKLETECAELDARIAVAEAILGSLEKGAPERIK